MEFSGVLPEDAPDPAAAQWAEVSLMPAPVYGFVAQPALEEFAQWSISSDNDHNGRAAMSVSISYTLWRVPEDRGDTRNLADLDEVTAASLDNVPPWPRPSWLVALNERMRYPMVWEAVRTSWQRHDDDRRDVHQILVEHMRYIAANRVPERSGADELTRPRPDLDDPNAPKPDTVTIDGTSVQAIRIEADEDVVGLGAQLANGTTVTVAVLRPDLAYLDLALATRWSPAS